MRGQANDAEQDNIAKDALGLLGGSDEPVLAVVVEKDLDFVTGFGGFGGESFWQKDAVAAIIEDEADAELSFNDQGIVFADVNHQVKVRYHSKSCVDSPDEEINHILVCAGSYRMSWNIGYPVG